MKENDAVVEAGERVRERVQIALLLLAVWPVGVVAMQSRWYHLHEKR